MTHIVLLGDSILDNAPYVERGQDVCSHLKRIIADDWRATLLAVDGSCLRDIPGQLQKLPSDATHLVFSCGGNDALEHLEILAEPSSGTNATLIRFNRVRRAFLEKYEEVLTGLVASGLPVTALTIYDPAFVETSLQEAAEAALCFFNDSITRTAFTCGVNLIDLRTLFDEPGDMANAIEPSSQGGLKIARAVRMVCGSPRTTPESVVYARSDAR